MTVVGLTVTTPTSRLFCSPIPEKTRCLPSTSVDTPQTREVGLDAAVCRNWALEASLF